MTIRLPAMAAPPECGILACWSSAVPGHDRYYAGLIERQPRCGKACRKIIPFIDGNKRTAFAVTYTFLAINGARLTADASETEAFVVARYSADGFEFEHLSLWLRANVKIGGVQT